MRNYSLLLLFVFFSLTSAAQYNSYQTFQTHEIGLINPAWYSSDKAVAVHAIGSKVAGMQGYPSAYAFGIALPLSMKSSGGLNLNHYSLGAQRELSASSFFAHSFKMSNRNQFLSAYLSAGFDRYTLVMPMPLDPNDVLVSGGDLHTTEATIGLGAMFYAPEKYFVGFSVPYLSLQALGLRAKQVKNVYSANYFLMAGYLGKINDVFKIKPVATVVLFKEDSHALFRNYDFSESSKLHSNVNLSTVLYIYDTYGIGVNYDTDKRIGAYAAYQPGNKLKISIAWNSYVGEELRMIQDTDFKLGVSYRFGSELLKKLL